MASSEYPSCYGNIFPDFSKLRFNVPCRGKVFAATLESVGIGVQSSCVDVDKEQWAQCVACPRYRHCYDLSLGRFVMQQAAHAHGG